MKSLLRNTILNGFGLFLTSQVLAGVKIEGGLTNLAIAGLALSVISFVLKPILTIITLPLNLLTFGAFSFVMNIILLYILTVLVPQIKISEFTFEGASFAGFVIPTIHLNTFFTFVVAAILLSGIISFFRWLIK